MQSVSDVEFIVTAPKKVKNNYWSIALNFFVRGGRVSRETAVKSRVRERSKTKYVFMQTQYGVISLNKVEYFAAMLCK